MENIEPKSFMLEISQYGKAVRKYNDTDYDRFTKVTKQLINDHIDNHSKQGANEVKNTTFHFYTY